MPLISKTPQWQALEEHWEQKAHVHMRDLFAQDPDRAKRFSLRAADLYLDYSKNRITEETLALLQDLAKAADLPAWMRGMFSGDRINNTEQRAVLHVALRNRSNRPIWADGEDVMPAINGVLEKMERFVTSVRSGDWVGYSGKRVTDVVNIGIGLSLIHI